MHQSLGKRIQFMNTELKNLYSFGNLLLSHSSFSSSPINSPPFKEMCSADTVYKTIANYFAEWLAQHSTTMELPIKFEIQSKTYNIAICLLQIKCFILIHNGQIEQFKFTSSTAGLDGTLSCKIFCCVGGSTFDDDVIF